MGIFYVKLNVTGFLSSTLFNSPVFMFPFSFNDVPKFDVTIFPDYFNNTYSVTWHLSRSWPGKPQFSQKISASECAKVHLAPYLQLPDIFIYRQNLVFASFLALKKAFCSSVCFSIHFFFEGQTKFLGHCLLDLW